jgi:hypothetical protein
MRLSCQEDEWVTNEDNLESDVRSLLALDAERAAYGRSPADVRYLILDFQRALRAVDARWRAARSTPPLPPAAAPPRWRGPNR